MLQNLMGILSDGLTAVWEEECEEVSVVPSEGETLPLSSLTHCTQTHKGRLEPYQTLYCFLLSNLIALPFCLSEILYSNAFLT